MDPVLPDLKSKGNAKIHAGCPFHRANNDVHKTRTAERKVMSDIHTFMRCELVRNYKSVLECEHDAIQDGFFFLFSFFLTLNLS